MIWGYHYFRKYPNYLILRLMWTQRSFHRYLHLLPLTNRLKTFAGQWRHEKFSDDVHDPQCRESNWITQTLKRWWIVNVRSLFKKIAPQEKKTHTTTMSMTYLKPTGRAWKYAFPKMRLVFQPSIVRSQTVSFRECRLHPSDVMHFLTFGSSHGATFGCEDIFM